MKKPIIIKSICNSILFLVIVALTFVGCEQASNSNVEGDEIANPLLRGSNEIIGFADLTTSNIAEAARISVERAEADLAIIKKVEQRNFENTIRAYDRIYNAINKIILPLDLIIEVDPREDIRNSAKEAQASLKDFFYKLDVDEELYKAINDYAKSDEAGSIDKVKKRLLTKMLWVMSLRRYKFNESDIWERITSRRTTPSGTLTTRKNQRFGNTVRGLFRSSSKGTPRILIVRSLI